MGRYILRRCLLVIPTLFGITLVCFFIINLAPGSPVEQKISQITMGGGHGSGSAMVTAAQIEELKRLYGFDKPIHARYLIWLKNIATLDFGNSFKYEQPVTQVLLDKLPVSLQFGISSAILIYLISVPLGIAKAVGMVPGLTWPPVPVCS